MGVIFLKAAFYKGTLQYFYMKITASVTKSSHQDRGSCYLHLQWALVLTNSEGIDKNCSI